MSRDGKRPVVVGSGLEDKYSPISFAVDFSYFKQVLGKVIEISGLEGATDQISLKEINILSLQPAFQLGWNHELETLVFCELFRFVRNRPIVSAQSLSRPWQPS